MLHGTIHHIAQLAPEESDKSAQIFDIHYRINATEKAESGRLNSLVEDGHLLFHIKNLTF
jgi:hypothetical protein